MKICLNEQCKTENIDSAKFCSKCGTKFVLNTNVERIEQPTVNELTTPTVDTSVNELASQETSEPAKNESASPIVNVSLNEVAPQATSELVATETTEQTVALPANNHTSLQQTPSENQQKKNDSKKVLIGIGTVASLAIIGTATYFLLNQSPIKALEKATENNDVDKFYEELKIADDVYVDEDTYKNYLKNNGLETIYNEIEYTYDLLKQYDGESEIVNVNGDDMFVVQQEGSKIVVEPVASEVTLNSEYSDLTFNFEGKSYEVTAGENVVLGQFLPGVFEYELVGDFGYIEASQTKSLEITPNESVLQFLDFDVFEVDVYSSYQDATLVIDGKETDMQIDDFLGLTLPTGDSYDLSAQLVVDGKTFESEIYSVKDSDTVTFSFTENPELAIETFTEQDATAYLDSFRSNFESALNSINFDLISSYFDASTELYDEYKYFINDHATFGNYSYSFLGNEYRDFKKLDNNKAVVTTYEEFYYVSDQDGTYLYERLKQYTLVFNTEKGMFEIENIEIKDTKKTKQ